MANRQIRKIAAVMMAAAMVFTVTPVVTGTSTVTAEAAKKTTVKLSKKSLKLTDKNGVKLSLKGTKKGAKITWTSSNKKVATVKAAKNGKSVTVKAVADGKTNVVAKVGKKKYTCNVTVALKKEETESTDAFDTLYETAQKGADTTVAVSGSSITAKVVTSDKQKGTALGMDCTYTIGLGAVDKDTLLCVINGKTATSPVSGVVEFTRDGQVRYIRLTVGADEASAMIYAEKTSPVPAAAVNNELTGLTFDKTSGLFAKSAGEVLKTAIGWVNDYMTQTFGFGLSKVGFVNYK